jgi:hypothetical protein
MRRQGRITLLEPWGQRCHMQDSPGQAQIKNEKETYLC